MSNISVDYDILNQKQTPAFYASSLATRPAFGFPGRIFIDTDTPSSGIYRDTGSAWVQVADPGAGTTGTLQQVTTNGNTTTLGIVVQGININDGAGTGVNNIAIGSTALSINTIGQYNTAIGSNNLEKNTTGQGNTAIGYNTLIKNISGINNTAVGVSTLVDNTTGNYNIAVGNGSLASNTTAEYNTAIGFTSLTLNTTGANNTALGNSSLASNTTASFNTAIGSSSLAANTTGVNNVAVGYISLNANTTGANNTSLGASSLNLNTTGQFNTAIGYGTLSQNITSNFNTALGFTALSVNTGANNTAIGSASLVSNTTGANNTAIGYTSGNAITTGSNNTILGNYVGTPTLASNIVLSDGAGNVRLFSNDTGKVGINVPITDTPTGQVDIHTSLTNALVLNGNTTNNAYLGFASANVNKWRIGNTYNAGANSFDIYNLGTSSTALSFNSTTNAATFGGTGEFSINNGTNTYVPIITLANNSSGANDYSWGKSVVNDLSLRNDNNNYFAITFQNQGTYANVGLGETAPNCKLDVVGLSNASNTYGIITARNSLNGGISFGASSTSYVWIQGNVFGSGTAPIALNASGGNVLIGTTTDDTFGKLQVNGFAKATSYYSINGSVSVPALGTATVLTLSSTAVGVYIINANFGGQGNAIYGSTLIVVANANNFRIVTNGSGANAALTLSGANVQITNALGVNLDAVATAILIGNL